MSARRHGTRACYVFGPEPGSDRSRGCRCAPCCEANRAYARMQTKRQRRIRDGKTDPVLVDAREARRHLRWLARQGIGLRTVEDITGLNRKTLAEIRDGTSQRTRPATAERILAVGKHRARDGAYVDAAPTWKLIDDLLAHGWTRSAIARQLGSTAEQPALQLGRDRVTAANARAVAELHRRALVRVIAERERMREERARYRAQEQVA